MSRKKSEHGYERSFLVVFLTDKSDRKFTSPCFTECYICLNSKAMKIYKGFKRIALGS